MAAGKCRATEMQRKTLAGACAMALLAGPAMGSAAEAPQVTWLDRIEVTATPIPGTTIDAAQLPYMVQSANRAELSRGRSNNLGDLLQRRFVGVDGNDVQGSAFQNDLTFHGFRASALPGASQGVSVYLDGVRFNEPFADIVSWDMLPEAAINAVTLMPGSNPLFGPNTLGGAVVLTTASGLTAPGAQGELSIGSGARSAWMPATALPATTAGMGLWRSPDSMKTAGAMRPKAGWERCSARSASRASRPTGACRCCRGAAA